MFFTRRYSIFISPRSFVGGGASSGSRDSSSLDCISYVQTSLIKGAVFKNAIETICEKMNLLDLGSDFLTCTVLLLDTTSVLNLSLCCKKLRSVATGDLVWKKKYYEEFYTKLFGIGFVYGPTEDGKVFQQYIEAAKWRLDQRSELNTKYKKINKKKVSSTDVLAMAHECVIGIGTVIIF